VLDDAVATQDTVTQLVAAVRKVLRLVPAAGPLIADRTAAGVAAHDYTDPGKPKIAWDDEQARRVLIDALVRDALALLAGLPEQEPGDGADAVGLLALVAGQDVELVDPDPQDPAGAEGPRWRIAQRVAPDRVISTVDRQARHAHKTVHRRQDGFKAHLAVEPDTGLVTACTISKASGADSSDATVGIDLLTDETEHLQVLGDCAYGSGNARAVLADAGHTAVIKPIPLRPAVPGGFTADDFTVDTTAGTVTCPNGLTRTLTASRAAVFGVACASCPLRVRCTSSRKGRTIKLHEHEDLLRGARRQAERSEHQALYRSKRPLVERAIAWLVRGGNRRLRFRGIAKNDQWLHHRTAGLNLRRLLNLGLNIHNGTWALA